MAVGGIAKDKNEIDFVAINKEIRKVLIGEVKANPQKFDKIKLRAKA